MMPPPPPNDKQHRLEITRMQSCVKLHTSLRKCTTEIQYIYPLNNHVEWMRGVIFNSVKRCEMCFPSWVLLVDFK